MLRLDTLLVPTSTKFIQERLSDKTLELRLGFTYLTCTRLHPKIMSFNSVNSASTPCKSVALNTLKEITLTMPFLYAEHLMFQELRLLKLRY